jgi:hypothetical protein
MHHSSVTEILILGGFDTSSNLSAKPLNHRLALHQALFFVMFSVTEALEGTGWHYSECVFCIILR